MTVEGLCQNNDLTLIAGANGLQREIEGIYIGDMLSWVMGRAQEKQLWITIQTNLNILAVALMADISCIVVVEDADIPHETIKKANDEGIPLFQSSLTAYELAIKLTGADVL
ncbi:DRTGG domain-containing protein [Anoxynatronum buryatiense]|uniref:DRTGG domain-containing protein n=1 Tax=Anoxynatronum buryatiense TaxID=489973 RepID=A0AA46AIG6_9CLOT|nr:DRTGG domain-containing protein [Anoxynatronum buryatiense]SMP49824.1 DRTGG domain-containing protein [Anoxynatronum buryatiense]